MRMLTGLFALMLVGCGETPPAEKMAQAAANQAAENVLSRQADAEKKAKFYAHLNKDAIVVCVNGTQYIAWSTPVGGHSTYSNYSMTPVIINGAHRICTGGVTLQM